MLDDSQKLDDSQDHEGHWVAVSDLMAGLMMVFMLVSVVFMINVETERDKIRDVAILYDQLRTQLYKDLETEFADDMPRWGAELDEDLNMTMEEDTTTTMPQPDLFADIFLESNMDLDDDLNGTAVNGTCMQPEIDVCYLHKYDTEMSQARGLCEVLLQH